MQNYSIHPLEPFRSFWRNRSLIWQLSKREVVGRYRGSLMGILWSFFNPLLMLAVYTFFFSVVFNARWGTSGSKSEFALALFCGLIVHGFFAECVMRAPTLVVSNVSYVKKIVFPLEVLPWVSAGTALFHALVSALVLMVFSAVLLQRVSPQLIFLPLIFFPLVLVTCALSWVLASLGVYLRDVSQTVGIVTTVMLYVSPVFFPVSAMPVSYQKWLYLNPLTFLIEQGRDVMLFAHQPDFRGLAVYILVSLVATWLAFAWFQKSRRGFADVV